MFILKPSFTSYTYPSRIKRTPHVLIFVLLSTLYKYVQTIIRIMFIVVFYVLVILWCNTLVLLNVIDHFFFCEFSSIYTNEMRSKRDHHPLGIFIFCTKNGFYCSIKPEKKIIIHLNRTLIIIIIIIDGWRWCSSISVCMVVMD